MPSQERISRRKDSLQKKRRPMQARSRQRREEILAATGRLLEQVGFDDLTTTLVAKELGISVGSLYHYFPHKQAILHAMGEDWLAAYSAAMEQLKSLDLEHMARRDFAEHAVAELLKVYKSQKGMLPLVQALWAVPELRDLDEEHDTLVIREMSAMFARLGLPGSRAELQRLARVWLEMLHALLLTVVEQSGARANRSRADVVRLCCTLLEET